MGRHVRIVRDGHVADADGGHHHDGGQAAAVHLDHRDEPFVADEQPRLAPDAGAADGEQRARDVLPADHPTGDGRMHAVIVLGRQVGDEVGAAFEAGCGAGVVEQRRQVEQAPLRLQQLAGDRAPALDDRAVGRGHDATGRGVDGTSAGPELAREELVEAGVIGERLLCLADVDAVDAGEAGQHHLAQAGRDPEADAPADGLRHGAFRDDAPHRATRPIAKGEPTHWRFFRSVCGPLRTSNLRSARMPRQRRKGRPPRESGPARSMTFWPRSSGRRGRCCDVPLSCRSTARTRTGAGAAGWRPPRSRACSRSRSR